MGKSKVSISGFEDGFPYTIINEEDVKREGDENARRRF